MTEKEIRQGSLYGFDLVLKVPADFPTDDKIINEHTLEKYVKNEIARAKHLPKEQ